MRALIVAALVLIPSLAFGEGAVVKQSTCEVSWQAPQNNSDGTPLTDLKEYGVYVGANPTVLVTPFAVVAATSGDPAAEATAKWSCKNLAPGQYYAQLDAVDTSGNRSGRTPVVPFSLIPDPDVVAPLAPSVPVVTGP